MIALRISCLAILSSVILPSAQGRIISTLFGTPTHCSHNNVHYSCTLSLACWIIGGSPQPGCGQPTWFVACCVVEKSTGTHPPPPPQLMMPEATILRKRVDDFAGGLYENIDEECGLSREHRFLQKRIIGGREARFGQFPWQAHIRISAFQCGGVLVSSRYVATAAHCIIRARLPDIMVYLGELDTQDTGTVPELAPAEKHRVIKKIIHPLFEYRLSQPDRYDIALLKLSGGPTRVPHALHIAPICLPDDTPVDSQLLGVGSGGSGGVGAVTGMQRYDNALRVNDVDGFPGQSLAGKLAVVAGWGKVLPSTDQSGTNVLRSAVVPILDTQECIAWHNSKKINVELFPEMICAGHADGNQDACLGDSGGPLIVKIHGRWTLVGITSAGFGCGEPKQPGIYHSVSVTAPWIRHMINL